jgi:fructose-bisphosphate aldolase class I
MRVNEMNTFDEQLKKVESEPGFIAALDQSGGSTPKALKLYGIDESEYSSPDEMFALVHKMRTRIIENKAFNGDRILGAILFEDTLRREIAGMPTSQYLWSKKRVVPIIKVDKGLADEADGVQLMKPIPALGELLQLAKGLHVFGTKMRSVIKSADEKGIQRVVDQQFDIAKQILDHGLVPIIEPEVDINSPDKARSEEILRTALLQHLETLASDLPVMFKLTLPDQANYYSDFIAHPKMLRVVALSGGYTRAVANQKLRENTGMTASFSRALTEGLSASQSEEEFTAQLGESISEIYDASIT